MVLKARSRSPRHEIQLPQFHSTQHPDRSPLSGPLSDPYPGPIYQPLPEITGGAIDQALVSAASHLSSLDSRSGPKCLIRLGELPVICHVLMQLHHAGIKRVVLLGGYQGDKIREVIQKRLPTSIQREMAIDYILLGDAWQKGHGAAVMMASKAFKKDDKFLLCMASHIFDPSLIASMRTVPFKQQSEAYCLVETDIKGMVGMPVYTLKVQLDKTDISDIKVENIYDSVEFADVHGVNAGLFACDTSLFDRLMELDKSQAHVTLAEALDSYTGQSALHVVKTNDKMWFAVETKESLAHAVANGLKEMGTVPDHQNWLGGGAYDQDGKAMSIIPAGRGPRGPRGSKWEEFSVERWRSAVYINMSYFGDLYTDTINFVKEIATHIKLRGERVSLIEVGCGTGEFIRPMVDHFQVSIGVDFNANFIEYCIDNVPKGKEKKAFFLHGDACNLMELMKKKAPSHIWSDTRIVSCVGNTIGIIPEELKQRVYQQMAELAGPKGVVVIVYWNAKCFGDACQNFYYANPQLCGPFDGSAIDFATTTLCTPPPVSYRSHWTGVDEARAVLKQLNLEEIVVEEKGKGVLVAARRWWDEAQEA